MKSKDHTSRTVDVARTRAQERQTVSLIGNMKTVKG